MKRIDRKSTFLAAAGFSFMPATAFAHLVNANVKGFYSGMLHPVTAADHLLPVLALAILASQLGKRAGRMTVLFFPSSMLVGILLGNFFALPSVFNVANISILIILGILIIASEKLTVQSAAVCAAATGLVLGWRSGMDWAASSAGFQFVPGVVLTAFILSAVVVAWLPHAIERRERILRISTGAGILIAGVFLATKLLPEGETILGRSIGLPSEESLKALVETPRLSPAFIVGACFAAMAWGAAHALTPGHGKAIVAAYLVGARSTPVYALYLGLTVTVTHTLVVFIMGGTAVLASKYIAPETLDPVLAFVSGLILFILGIVMLANRLRRPENAKPDHAGHDPHFHSGDRRVHSHEHHAHGHDHHVHQHHDHHVHQHRGLSRHRHDRNGHSAFRNYSHAHDHRHAEHDHEHVREHHHTLGDLRAHGERKQENMYHSHGGRVHSHLPPGADGARVTWRSLLALGIGAGLLPCPSAMILLLTAVALQRVGFGLLLVAAFSVGLAGVLTVVGLLFIKGSQLIHEVRKPVFLKALRFAPAAGALVVCLLGGGIVWDSVSKLIG